MKDNRVIIGAIVVIFIIIIILFNVVMGLVGSKDTKKKAPVVDKEYKKQVEDVEKGKVTGKYETTNTNESYYRLGQEGRDIVDERLDYIMDLLNSKKYEEIYSLLAINYKNAMFPTLDDLKTYIDKLGDDVTFVVNSFEVYDDVLFFDVGKQNVPGKVATFVLYDYEINSGDKFDSDGFERRMTLYFSDILSVDKTRFIYYNDLIRIESEYSMEHANSYSLLLNITNKTDKEMKIDFNGTKLGEEIADITNTYGMVTTRYVTVPAGETVKYEMGFRLFKVAPSFVELHMAFQDKTFVTNVNIVDNSIDDD